MLLALLTAAVATTPLPGLQNAIFDHLLRLAGLERSSFNKYSAEDDHKGLSSETAEELYYL